MVTPSTTTYPCVRLLQQEISKPFEVVSKMPGQSRSRAHRGNDDAEAQNLISTNLEQEERSSEDESVFTAQRGIEVVSSGRLKRLRDSDSDEQSLDHSLPDSSSTESLATCSSAHESAHESEEERRVRRRIMSGDCDQGSSGTNDASPTRAPSTPRTPRQPPDETADAIIDLTGDTPTAPRNHERRLSLVDLTVSPFPITEGNASPMNQVILDLTSVDDAVSPFTVNENDDVQILSYQPPAHRPMWTHRAVSIGSDGGQSPTAVDGQPASLTRTSWVNGAYGEWHRAVTVISSKHFQSAALRRMFRGNASDLSDSEPIPTSISIRRPPIPAPPPASAIPATPSDKVPPTLRLQCAICLEEVSPSVQLSSTICGHIFCEECVKSALKVTKKCPVCRKSLSSKNSIHRLYI
ncbi:hypothetical protein BC832DRAFT_341578 [Gaertneriomyces semiglobifer]|nr:hypothetical protein BC832DRAFT_341578 [Gaertneriomyces semiglobifer]